MSEPEEGRFRDSENTSLDELIGDAYVPATSQRAVPYLTQDTGAYSMNGGYSAKSLASSAPNQSLYADRSAAPYQGSNFDGNLAEAYPYPTTDPALPNYRALGQQSYQ